MKKEDMFEPVNNVFDEWKDMPEFVQEKQKPFKELVVRFRNKHDLDAFAALVGQPLTLMTKSIWHPRLVRGVDSAKRWVDEP